MSNNYDNEIQSVVFALNNRDYKTYSSCEGHINNKDKFVRPYPWVTLSLSGKAMQVQKKLGKITRMHIRYDIEYTNNFDKLNEVFDENDAKSFKEIVDKTKKAYSKYQCELEISKQERFIELHELIYEFNETFTPKFPLQIHDNMLCNLYCDRQWILSPDNMEKNLKEMQKIMQQFAVFLRLDDQA